MNDVVAKIERNQCRGLEQRLRPSAARGDVDAMRNLGLIYERGCGVNQNGTTAASWYAKAAANHSAGDYGLAVMYIHGVGVPLDGTRALAHAMNAAKSGSFGAAYLVAQLYEFGEAPLKRDASQSATWARVAADRGDTRAQLLLGQLYLDGDGVAKDANRAKALFDAAAKRNDPPAQTQLAYLYEAGIATPKDERKAVAYYRLAADGLDSGGQEGLGLAYFLGKGVRQDITAAQRWATLSAEQGFSVGMKLLGDVLKKKGDYAHAERWYRRAAELGLPVAQNDLAICYWYGWGVRADFQQAVRWYRIAAANGDPNAKGNLAQLRVVADQDAPMPSPVPAFKYLQSGSMQSGDRQNSPLDNPLSGESQFQQGVEDQNRYEATHPGTGD